MNSLSLINRVKYSKFLFRTYRFFGSMLISLMKHFMRSDDHLIIFASFGGRKYDDSPKVIYETMLNDKRFDGYRLIWAFIHPEEFELLKGEKVRIDSIMYYKLLLKARVWVTNSSMTRGLNICGINTFELNTWHGSAIKYLGCNISPKTKSFALKGDWKGNQIMLAQGRYDVNIMSKAFNRPVDSFRITGLPRNDVLSCIKPEDVLRIKEKLALPKEKIVILYAPTFREYEKDAANNVIFAPPISLKKWAAKLGNKYLLLFRAHYEVVKVMGIEDNEFVRNVSMYPDLNELMIASDVLVSDYSSIYFDYAIMGKPMLCFAYDYDHYKKERGLYFDIRQELNSWISNEDELLDEIVSMNYEHLGKISQEFREKYVESYGSAASNSLNIIFEEINNK